ncbi:unnamed protein product [Discosporangium mesarthrocarpum]
MTAVHMVKEWNDIMMSACYTRMRHRVAVPSARVWEELGSVLACIPHAGTYGRCDKVCLQSYVHSRKPVTFFDWSCHDCLQEGAHSVSKMRVGVGGTRKGVKWPPLNPTTLLESAPLLEAGTVQISTFGHGEGGPIKSRYMPHSE